MAERIKSLRGVDQAVDPAVALSNSRSSFDRKPQAPAFCCGSVIKLSPSPTASGQTACISRPEFPDPLCEQPRPPAQGGPTTCGRVPQARDASHSVVNIRCGIEFSWYANGRASFRCASRPIWPGHPALSATVNGVCHWLCQCMNGGERSRQVGRATTQTHWQSQWHTQTHNLSATPPSATWPMLPASAG